jgi:hypothetical protein
MNSGAVRQPREDANHGIESACRRHLPSARDAVPRHGLIKIKPGQPKIRPFVNIRKYFAEAYNRWDVDAMAAVTIAAP